MSRAVTGSVLHQSDWISGDDFDTDKQHVGTLHGEKVNCRKIDNKKQIWARKIVSFFKSLVQVIFNLICNLNVWFYTTLPARYPYKITFLTSGSACAVVELRVRVRSTAAQPQSVASLCRLSAIISRDSRGWPQIGATAQYLLVYIYNNNNISTSISHYLQLEI